MARGPAASTVADHIGRGDLVLAYDLAMTGLRADPGDPDLRYLAVLALARMDATEEALRACAQQDVAAIGTIDARALQARLLKDQALATSGPQRIERLTRAARAYGAVFEETGDCFPGVNAATLHVLAGDTAAGQAIARRLLDTPALSAPAGYYDYASLAEAYLVLGRMSDAVDAVRRAADRAGTDYGALSTTRRQLTVLLTALGAEARLAAPLLAQLVPGRVIQFTGHMFASDLDEEPSLAEAVRRRLDEDGVICGFGSLACGADILFAEALIARGAECHVVLPSPPRAFIESSVKPGGGPWVPRFERCLAAAASRMVVGHDAFADDPTSFAFAAQTAMGLAKIRARHLGVTAVQIAISDGSPATGPAGTAADMAIWQNHGGQTRIVPMRTRRRPNSAGRPLADAAGPRRQSNAMLFADFAGFSRIAETDLPVFWTRILGGIAAVIDRHAAAVKQCDTWGDAIYLAVEDPVTAAHIAHQIQDAACAPAATGSGALGAGAMRIALNYGLVFQGWDPILRRTAYFGTEVSRAARVEPVTPPGFIYATAAFAASLALRDDSAFKSSYLGIVPLAKNYGDEQLFRIARP